MSIALSPIIIVAILLVAVIVMGFVGRAMKKKAAAEPLDASIGEDENLEGQNKTVLWLKRLGFAGFMFFFIKGLVWLAIFYYAGKSF